MQEYVEERYAIQFSVKLGKAAFETLATVMAAY